MKNFVLQNGILYANFCLVLYLCVMGDNTNTSLNNVGNIALLCFTLVYSTYICLSDRYSLSAMLKIKVLCDQKSYMTNFAHNFYLQYIYVLSRYTFGVLPKIVLQ